MSRTVPIYSRQYSCVGRDRGTDRDFSYKKTSGVGGRGRRIRSKAAKFLCAVEVGVGGDGEGKTTRSLEC